MLISVGGAPLVEGLGLERIEITREKGIVTDDRRCTTVGHIGALVVPSRKAAWASYQSPAQLPTA